MDNLTGKIKEQKIIAIVRGIPAEKIIRVADALYDGGIRLMEIPFDQSETISPDDTANAIRTISERYPDIDVGAGTVVTIEQLISAYRAKAKYIISPNCDEEIIRETVKLGMLSIPGAFSPSEIQNAYHYGASFVKIFPAGNLGVDYIKAITAPLNNIPYLAVGGVDINNMKEFYAAGICGFGIGGNLVDSKLIRDEMYDELAGLAKRYVEYARSLA